MTKINSLVALTIALLMVAPSLLAMASDNRETSFVRQITTFSDGKTERIVSFGSAGNDTTVKISIPNGATVLSATMNVTGLPYVTGTKDYPENITINFGGDNTVEWAFNGTGYGQMGHQTLISNTTNFTSSLKVPFYQGGVNNSIMIRLPKDAVISKATLDLEGSHGTGPALINSINKKQAWAPNNWITTNPMMVNELNGQILYNDIEFDLSSIPDTVFVSNATFWMGRQGTSYYATNGFSFADSLGVHRIDESWQLNTQKIFKESNPPEDTNMMVSPNVDYDWNITQMMSEWVVGAYPNYGLCLHRTQAATQDKWDYSTTPYITAAYGSPGNVTFIMTGGANVKLFDKVGTFDTLASVPDFSATLNSYLKSHAANSTDAWGNEMVDIPFSLSSTDPGRVAISAVDIVYDYSTVVDKNPSVVNLTGELNHLVNPAIDGGSTDITLTIFSNSTGKLKLSDLKIEFMPPDHFPTIDTRLPQEEVLVMNENETKDFVITASDLYKFPLTVTWYLNDVEVLKGQYNWSFYADFDAAQRNGGHYNLTVVVDNLWHRANASWDITVKNVNRRPIIDSYDPSPLQYGMDENSTTTFSIKAHDPDNDKMMYSWNLDDKSAGSITDSYVYKADYFSQGIHTLKVSVQDPGKMVASLIWVITVRDVNAAPLITSSDPKVLNVEMYENSTSKFSLVDKSLDEDKHTIYWFLDGKDTSVTGRAYEYHADFESSGNHTVMAQVSDGLLTTNRTWLVSVIDVNRAPIPKIDKPYEGQEFLEWDHIQIDGSSSKDPDRDKLNLSWTDGNSNLGYGEKLTVDLKHGKHTIILSVDDGRGNGQEMTQVEIVVRYIKFDAIINTSKPKPVADDDLIVMAALTNIGDGSYSEMTVYFWVDGQNISGQAISDIEPNGVYPVQFPWKAKQGIHTLEFHIGSQNLSQTITVGKKPLINKDNALFVFSLLAIIIIAFIVVAVVLVARRRKSKAAQKEVPVAAPVQAAPVQSQPTTWAPIAPPAPAPAPPAYYSPPPPQAQPVNYPPPPPPPPPVAYAPPPVYAHATVQPQQVAVAQPIPAAPLEDEGQASEAMSRAEAVIAAAEQNGKDTLKARNTLRIAQNFYSKGKFSRAVHYCQQAEAALK